jgi:hypothetical protein
MALAKAFERYFYVRLAKRAGPRDPCSRRRDVPHLPTHAFHTQDFSLYEPVFKQYVPSRGQYLML